MFKLKCQRNISCKLIKKLSKSRHKSKYTWNTIFYFNIAVPEVMYEVYEH